MCARLISFDCFEARPLCRRPDDHLPARRRGRKIRTLDSFYGLACGLQAKSQTAFGMTTVSDRPKGRAEAGGAVPETSERDRRVDGDGSAERQGREGPPAGTPTR